jgi:hypothetical protein
MPLQFDNNQHYASETQYKERQVKSNLTNNHKPWGDRKSYNWPVRLRSKLTYFYRRHTPRKPGSNLPQRNLELCILSLPWPLAIRGGPGPVRAVRPHRAQKMEGPKNFYISIGSLVYYVQAQPNNEHKPTTGNRIRERTTNRITRRQPQSLRALFIVDKGSFFVSHWTQ